MRYDINKEFAEHLNWAMKYNNAYFALAWTLQSIEDKKKIKIEHIKKFNNFRKISKYKKLLINSIKRFKKIIDDTEKTVAKYGWLKGGHYEDTDTYEEHKKLLKTLEKEAKKLGIKS